jgi:cyclophilin family peptidyl-prolyl cis-trans isomerase
MEQFSVFTNYTIIIIEGVRMKLHRVLSTILTFTLLIALVANAQDSMKTSTKPTEEKSKMTTSPGHMGKQMATVETSMGKFELELYADDAPKTVENFVKLAEKKYFDGMRVHRVSKGFVIQTGDDKSKDPKKVNEWGTGGQSIWGKEFEDELNANTPSYKEGYKKGVLAMANRGPNTNTSQFFICLGDVGLPHAYTIFGKVTKGMDVVEKIGAVEIIPSSMGPTDGRPKVDVLVKKIVVKK